MSAFVVEDKTINRIVTYLKDDRDASWSRKRLSNEIQQDVRLMPEVLGLAMFELNCRAVNERYGEGQAKEFRPLDYKFNYELANRMQALKSLRCWLYQCTEGDADKTELYKIMDDYSNSLAFSILADTPEYEMAEWA